MYIVRRKDGQTIEVTHRSGDVVTIHVGVSKSGRKVELAFDDPSHNFKILRREEKPVDFADPDGSVRFLPAEAATG